MPQAIAEFIVAFLIAPFPAAWKKSWAEGRHDAAAAQVASGVAQFILATILHFAGIIRSTGAFFDGPGMTLINAQAEKGQGGGEQVVWLGALGGFGYMASPAGLLLLYLVAEGIVRALDPPLTGNRPGTALLAVPAWLLGFAVRQAEERRLRVLLGPDRNDEWGLPANPAGPLWFYSVRTRELSPVQCVSWRGKFFVLDGPGGLAARGARRVFAFRFRPARPGELLRCAPWVVPEA